MSVKAIPVIGTSVNSDTANTANTLVMRANDGSINVTTSFSTEVSTGGLSGTTSAQTSSFTAAGGITDYMVDCTSAAVTVTLPAASANAGRIIYFHKVDSVTGHALTISGVSGTGSITAQYAQLRVVSDGSTWWSA